MVFSMVVWFFCMVYGSMIVNNVKIQKRAKTFKDNFFPQSIPKNIGSTNQFFTRSHITLCDFMWQEFDYFWTFLILINVQEYSNLCGTLNKERIIYQNISTYGQSSWL